MREFGWVGEEILFYPFQQVIWDWPIWTSPHYIAHVEKFEEFTWASKAIYNSSLPLACTSHFSAWWALCPKGLAIYEIAQLANVEAWQACLDVCEKECHEGTLHQALAFSSCLALSFALWLAKARSAPYSIAKKQVQVFAIISDKAIVSDSAEQNKASNWVASPIVAEGEEKEEEEKKKTRKIKRYDC